MQEAKDRDLRLVVDVAGLEELSVELRRRRHTVSRRRDYSEGRAVATHVEDDSKGFQQPLAKIEAVLLELAERFGVLSEASRERMGGNWWGTGSDIASVEP